MAIFTAIAAAISTWAATALVGTGVMAAGVASGWVATIIGYVAAAAIVTFGGQALSRILTNKRVTGQASSPTYGSQTLQTQTNNKLPVPIVYGEIKLAGNRIWQNDGSYTQVKRIVAFAEGEITDFSDIRLNDIPYTEISGCKVRKYYGTATQNIDSIIDGATNAERAEKVGSLRHIAYLAIESPITSKIDAGFNLTTIVKGRKVRIYTDENTYTTAYSNNPAWCLLDLLTSYNGAKIGVENDGTRNDTKIKEYIDIASFISAASYCDEKPLTGETGEKRYTFNYIFDSSWTLRDMIEEFKKNCMGALCIKGHKLQFKIDKDSTPVATITTEDIIAGSESVQTLPLDEHYDRLFIKYKDPSYDWSEVEALAELSTYFNEPAIEHRVDILSITNFKQAGRLAWHYLNRNRLCYYTGVFATDYRAADWEVGDVLNLNDLVMGFTNLKVKVVSIDDDGSGIFKVSWHQHDSSLYSDTVSQLEPIIIKTNVNNPFANPDDVQSFSAVQNQTLVEFAWTNIADVTAKYEIREGSSWEASTVIATDLTGNSYTSNLSLIGIKTYWIKAKTLYNYSVNAASDILNVQYLPDKNIVVNQNILIGASGAYTNTYLYNNKLKLSSTILWQDLTPETWSDTGVRYYANTDGNWGALTETTGNYISQIYDIGANLQSIISYNYDLYATDSSSNIVIEWRYSEDNITWSDYTLLNQGSYKFRYYQIKITMNSINGSNIWLNNFIVVVDVPDREENYTNREITNASNGIVITYSTDAESKQPVNFIINVPHVLATPATNNSYAVVTSSTSTNCTVKLYTNTGSLTTGFVNLRVRGY